MGSTQAHIQLCEWPIIMCTNNYFWAVNLPGHPNLMSIIVINFKNNDYQSTRVRQTFMEQALVNTTPT